MGVNIVVKANHIIKASDIAYIGLVGEGGYPMVSTIAPVGTENIYEAYFVTGTRSSKFKCLKNNCRGSVCFHKGGDNITLVGDVEVLTDQPTKSRYWQDDYKAFFPLGDSDPVYCVLKFTTNRVILWIDGETASFTIKDLLTVQSRCGLLCDSCSYKTSYGCAGCIALNGNPFWGECSVAKCCQDKGHTHCGECPDIPCEMLRDLSCGDSEHSDKPAGARIEMCVAWASRSGRAP
jgi:general stress protein 26